MSYCRFLEGDVYVFHVAGANQLTCCSCKLGPDPFTKSRQAMIEHLLAHEEVGDSTGDAVDRLRTEIEEIGDEVTERIGSGA